MYCSHHLAHFIFLARYIAIVSVDGQVSGDDAVHTLTNRDTGRSNAVTKQVIGEMKNLWPLFARVRLPRYSLGRISMCRASRGSFTNELLP
jgi:hypothetical protein